MAIGQTGDMQVVSTPMDAGAVAPEPRDRDDHRRLRKRFGQEEARARHARSEVAPAPVAAARLAYKTAVIWLTVAAGVPMGVAGGVVGGVSGGGDLVDDEAAGRAKLAALAKDQLPAEMQGLTADQKRAYLAKKRADREALQGQIADLVKKRQAHIEAELKKTAATGHQGRLRRQGRRDDPGPGRPQGPPLRSRRDDGPVTRETDRGGIGPETPFCFPFGPARARPVRASPAPVQWRGGFPQRACHSHVASLAPPVRRPTCPLPRGGRGADGTCSPRRWPTSKVRWRAAPEPSPCVAS